MNIQKMMYLLLCLAIGSISLNAVARGYDLTPRQLCERYHSPRECLDMERETRLQELQQQRARGAWQDNHRHDRDADDADTRTSEVAGACQCRRHPENCVAPPPKRTG
ncbi:MAG: hypothetical protein R3E08_09320 [Thiotrichaceae bacterium]